MAMRDGPERLASSSYQELPMRRALRCTSTEARLLAAMRNGVAGVCAMPTTGISRLVKTPAARRMRSSYEVQGDAGTGRYGAGGRRQIGALMNEAEPLARALRAIPRMWHSLNNGRVMDKRFLLTLAILAAA